jgi:CO dehydrogenase maturation factor
LRQFMDKLSSQYKYVIIDNEAGMEHLSRRTTNNVDLLLVVADATPIGIITAKRIAGLANELPITVKDIGIVWNRTDAAPEQDSQANGMQTFGCVPADQSVLQASMKGKNIFELDADSPALSAVREILDSRLEKLKD